MNGLRAVVVTSIVAALCGSARAQEPAPAPPASDPAVEEVRALEARVRALEAERRVRAAADAAATATATRAAADASAPRVQAVPGKGFGVATADGKYAITLRTRIQLRETYTTGLLAYDTNELAIRSFRVGASGNVLDKNLKFFTQLALAASEFEPGVPSPIYDAYVEYVGLRDLEVRFGQYYVPFDRARTVREFAVQFVDRQQVVRELSLDRDIGLMLSSTNLFGSNVLGYHVFVGGGEGKNRPGGQRVGPLAVGRLVIRPFGIFDDDVEADIGREGRPRLAIGAAAAYNYRTNRQLSTLGAVLTHGTVSYRHVEADLVFKYAGLSVLAEVLYRHADVDSVTSTIDGVEGTDFTRSCWGYFAQAGMMATAKVEVVARWEQLVAADGTDPALRQLVDRTGRQLGGGANLYLNGHAFKLQTDYFHAFADAGSSSNTIRFQIDATF